MQTRQTRQTNLAKQTATARPQQQIHVIGHQNPDTDAIAAAITYSYYLNQIGVTAKPYRLGDINQETQFLIDKAHVRMPEKLESLTPGSVIALVDHNEAIQSISRLSDYQVHSIIDHHKLGGLTTAEPIDMRLATVGSTCTLLFGMFAEKNLLISPQIALLMCGAIISDTLNLASPTTTDTDRNALDSLLHIAGIRAQAVLAKQLFEAKSNVSHLTGVQLVTSDYKQFQFGGKKWGIASIETVNPERIKSRLPELQQALVEVKTRDGLDYLMVVIVDILQQQSWAISSDTSQNQIISTAFESKVTDNLISLGNAVSRKKQFVPTLEKYYQTQA